MDMVKAESQLKSVSFAIPEESLIDRLNLQDTQERQCSKILSETPWFSFVIPDISDLTGRLSFSRKDPLHIFVNFAPCFVDSFTRRLAISTSVTRGASYSTGAGLDR